MPAIDMDNDAQTSLPSLSKGTTDKSLSPDLKQLIEENSTLFWYINKDKRSEISEDTVVEFILNYGSYEACKKLLNILGTKQVAKIFFKHLDSTRRKQNYFPEIITFFTKYFGRHAF
jgi:hypothetical protein